MYYTISYTDNIIQITITLFQNMPIGFIELMYAETLVLSLYINLDLISIPVFNYDAIEY